MNWTMMKSLEKRVNRYWKDHARYSGTVLLNGEKVCLEFTKELLKDYTAWLMAELDPKWRNYNPHCEDVEQLIEDYERDS